jgi:hypothetical protein
MVVLWWCPDAVSVSSFKCFDHSYLNDPHNPMIQLILTDVILTDVHPTRWPLQRLRTLLPPLSPLAPLCPRYGIAPKLLGDGDGWRVEEWHNSVPVPCQALPNPSIFCQVCYVMRNVMPF